MPYNGVSSMRGCAILLVPHVYANIKRNVFQQSWQDSPQEIYIHVPSQGVVKEMRPNYTIANNPTPHVQFPLALKWHLMHPMWILCSPVPAILFIRFGAVQEGVLVREEDILPERLWLLKPPCGKLQPARHVVW